MFRTKNVSSEGTSEFPSILIRAEISYVSSTFNASRKTLRTEESVKLISLSLTVISSGCVCTCVNVIFLCSIPFIIRASLFTFYKV